MATGEVYVRIRGSGMVAVDELIRSKRLVFDVVETRHRGVNLDQTARKIMATYPHLCDALIYATAKRYHIRFRHGVTVSFNPEECRFLIGIDGLMENNGA